MADYEGTVPDLAGQLDDPLAEKALALLFTDKPVRRDQQPGDHRNHWQWAARTDRDNLGSHIWRSMGEPLTDDTVSLMQSRAKTALAPLTRPTDGTGVAPATAVDVLVQQVSFTAVQMTVTISRLRDVPVTLGVVLEQGASVYA